MRRYLIVLAIALVASTACANSQPNAQKQQQDPVSLIAGFRARAESVGTARLSMTGTVSAQGQSLNISGSGLTNFKDRFGSITMTMSGLPQVGNLKMELIFSGTTIYMKLPAALRAQAGSQFNKPWIKMDLSKVAGGANPFGSSSTSDPTAFLDMLSSVSSNVHSAGTLRLDGVTTTEYDADIDLNKAAANYPESTKKLIEQFKTANGSTLPVKVWIGDDKLVRRESFSWKLSSSGTAATMDMQIDLSDYGVAVFETLPASSEVQVFTPPSQ
ncbi:MAG: hypothetical protein ABR552_08040 [Actinomycetota bacterium]